MELGRQAVEFDASSLASGAYFYRIVVEVLANVEEGIAASKFTSVRKMMLV
jgi:hypothetical protein